MKQATRDTRRTHRPDDDLTLSCGYAGVARLCHAARGATVEPEAKL